MVASQEVVALLKPALAILGVLVLLNLASSLLQGAALDPAFLLRNAARDFVPFLGALLTGTVLVPALLPYLPGRAFSWKGLFLGLLWTLAVVFYLIPVTSMLQAVTYFLLLPAISALLALNLTGSSTYTSLSGVLKEMSFAMPAMAVAAVLGAAGLIVSFFV